MASLDSITPVVISPPRVESNSQYDFMEFIVYLIENNYLMAGDKLIMDNASIHGGKDTQPLLETLLSVADVELIYLPTYSPELNPCELVFMKVKRRLREFRTERSLKTEILEAFATVTSENVHNFYRKCYNLRNNV